MSFTVDGRKAHLTPELIWAGSSGDLALSSITAYSGFVFKPGWYIGHINFHDKGADHRAGCVLYVPIMDGRGTLGTTGFRRWSSDGCIFYYDDGLQRITTRWWNTDDNKTGGLSCHEIYYMGDTP